MKAPLKPLATVLVAGLLTGCAAPKLTVDDGRKIDENLLQGIRDYTQNTAALRPAILRTAKLDDPECDKQYELPFDAWSSFGLRDEQKIGWVRLTGFTENLSVSSPDPVSGLVVGDVIVEIAGYPQSRNMLKYWHEMVDMRDAGKPFKLKLESGKEVTVTPVKVCRGRSWVAAATTPKNQAYHWEQTVHPQEVFSVNPTSDELTWVALWSQGLSEVGGARMKTYSYTTGALTFVAKVGLTMATGGLFAAGAGAASASTSAAMGQLASKTTSSFVNGYAGALANRAALSGISGVAAGVFDQADQWAFERAQKLGIDPHAGLTLNAKLVQKGLVANAFVLDEERAKKLQALADALPAVTTVTTVSVVQQEPLILVETKSDSTAASAVPAETVAGEPPLVALDSAPVSGNALETAAGSGLTQ